MTSLQKLSKILSDVQDTALQLHERSELDGAVPILDYERSILPYNRRFSDEIRASMLWHFLLFTEPRITSQKKFQTSLSTRLTKPESALVVRQLMCRPPRAWSYRCTYQKAFVHAITGPNHQLEISVDGCLSACGAINDIDHIYAFGWIITYEDKTFFIHAAPINLDQIRITEMISPFPKQINADDFWEENLFEILRAIFEATPLISLINPKALEATDYNPEQRHHVLQRILTTTMATVNYRNATPFHVTVATGTPDVILEQASQIIAANIGTTRRTVQTSILLNRFLEACGCEPDGNMPRAHFSLLTSDPIALLLLNPEHPVFASCSLRDSIKQALAYDEQNGTHDVMDAFQIYQRERRWLAAFPCFDFSNEMHAQKFGIPTQMLQTIFDPRLFTAKLPITPQDDVLRQLQTKFGFYQPDTPPPTFEAVLRAFTHRSFQTHGNMSNIVNWIFSCCSRWRYCMTEIEPDATGTQRTVNQTNQKLLKKGLKGLADMFKKS